MTAHTEREGLRAHVRDLERQIARLRAENMAARDRTLEEAAYEVAELLAHDCAEREWPCGERLCRTIATAIRALKGAKT